MKAAVVGRMRSPRVRGWSQRAQADVRRVHVLPARAGVVPKLPMQVWNRASAPRACGGGPRTRRTSRSWSWRSPRVRGWSRLEVPPGERADVLPARAGVVPRRSSPSTPANSAPRACGGGPTFDGLAMPRVLCSPRVRGWSLLHRHLPLGRVVLPAHAGVGPSIPMRRRGESNDPTREGDPASDQTYSASTPLMCRSVHTSTLPGASSGTPPQKELLRARSRCTQLHTPQPEKTHVVTIHRDRPADGR